MGNESGKGMLLVVERDPRFTEKYKKHLKVGDLRPFFVESGKDALYLLESMPAAFMLINLNGIRSWEDLNGLMAHAKEQRVPFLFVEGLRKTQGIVDRLRQKGYDSFIKLPYSIKTLSRRIESLLDGDNMLGRQLGPEGQRVVLLSPLGRGASGQVYQAHQKELDRQVAVKFLSPDHLNDQESVSRFNNEARAIAQMRSPYIVQVYFVGNDNGRPYLVMEYINGPTLEKYIRSKGSLKPARALKITREILQGLAEAHSHDKIHRDLKPANVMLNRKGQAVILDFGLVRESGGNLTKAGMVMGTPRYISPEQVQGKPLDARCDFYSLGIMLFEMLLGEVPYQGKDLVSVLWKHVKEPLPSPADFGKTIDPGIWAIVQKLCAKEPDQRYKTAEEILRDVDGLLERQEGSMVNLPSSDTQELLQQVRPLGGMAVNESGSPTHQFGEIPGNRAELLHMTRGLVSQLQDMADLGNFHRGLITLDGHKLMAFECYDGLAAIETAESDITTKFNMMDTGDLTTLFRKEFR